ncbi:MAG: arylsulfatase [Pseudomonadota bacterium]
MLTKHYKWLLVGFAALAASCSKEPNGKVDAGADADDRPNILIIVADDLGYSDLGSFGGEIETPNLDELANNGVRMVNFHVAPTCSPTRAMLLTGVDNHIAGLGNMLEERAPNQAEQPGYEGYLNDRVVSLPQILNDQGYATFLSGKWHLGLTDETGPTVQGFEKSFSMLQGGASHFNDMAPIYAEDPDNVPKAKYREDGQLLDELPPEFEFSSQFYVDKMIDYIESDSESGRPFFAYLSFTAPHWPLQAPEDVIDKYKGRYDDGYEALQKTRLLAQQGLGIVPEEAGLGALEVDAVPWSELDDQQKKISARSMEIYAAMVDNMDAETGRLIRYLKDKNLLNNTLVLFLSDNGAEGHDMEGLWNPQEFPAAYKWIMESHDFSLDGMGGENSYVLYGPGWGGAAAPAMQGYKAFPTEGGTRSAAFVHFPKEFNGGVLAHHLMHVKDITPTILDLVGVERPGDSYRGRPIEPITGLSVLPVWRGQVSVAGASDRMLGTELFGKRAIRHRNWKIVHMPEPHGTGDWQLYDLDTDLGEANDLAAEQPEKLTEMVELWDRYAEENNVILPDWVSGY